MTNNNLKKALTRLNRSKSISARLIKEGCKGWTNSATSCPVSIWLQKQGFYYPLVGLTGVSSRFDRAAIPAKIAIFIEAFDHNLYPELKFYKI